MCVIIVKPAGVAMPSTDILRAAAIANPHGFGFATPNHVYKNLRYDKFIDKLSKVPASMPCIMHFRYATHGSVKQSNCHPFRRGDLIFAHNGVLSIQPLGDMTDSETCLQQVVAPAVHKFGLDSQQAESIINEAREGSRFAIMQESSVRLYGDFKLANDGCYYSNFNFRYALKYA